MFSNRKCTKYISGDDLSKMLPVECQVPCAKKNFSKILAIIKKKELELNLQFFIYQKKKR